MPVSTQRLPPEVPELPEPPDDPDLPEEPDEPDDPEEPELPDDALRSDCPPDPEPDFSPLEEPDEPDEPLIPPGRAPGVDELELPRLLDVPGLSAEPELPLMPPCDPDDPLDPLCEPDDPELPRSASGSGELLDDDALRPELVDPSPCDEPSRSRLELRDEPLVPLCSLLDDPEVFLSRSAIVLSS